VPDTRPPRGPNPQDALLFSAEIEPMLNRAVGDLSWLLSRHYAGNASLKLVGDRYQLTERQRVAVMRCSCGDQDLRNRQQRQVACEDWAGRHIDLDGFNVLTTVEAALAGGVLLLARDGCLRDMASMHGSFRRVEETRPALELVGQVLQEFRTGHAAWYLDRPVSNSGRLASLIRQAADENGWPWEAEPAMGVDDLLARSPHLVASADCAVLDRCAAWCNLAREVVQRRVPAARILRLTGV
jgi:hypothetical protein